jgi:hypothetical protein
MEIANSVEPVQDGRIHIELINWPFLQEHRGSPAELQGRSGLGDRTRLAVAARERDRREVHPSRLRAVRMKPRRSRMQAQTRSPGRCPGSSSPEVGRSVTGGAITFAVEPNNFVGQHATDHAVIRVILVRSVVAALV